MSRRNIIRNLFEKTASNQIVMFADCKLKQPYDVYKTQYDWLYAQCFDQNNTDSEIVERIVRTLEIWIEEPLKYKAKKVLTLATVFALSQVLNKKQTEKILRKIGLDMPEKTKYKI